MQFTSDSDTLAACVSSAWALVWASYSAICSTSFSSSFVRRSTSKSWGTRGAISFRATSISLKVCERRLCDVHVAWGRSPHLLELLLLGPALLGPHFALDVLHHFDVGLQVFGDSLGEDEVEHEVVSLRLQHGDCIGWRWGRGRQTQVGEVVCKLCSKMREGRAGAPWTILWLQQLYPPWAVSSAFHKLRVCTSAPHYLVTCRPDWSWSYSLGSTNTTHPWPHGISRLSIHLSFCPLFYHLKKLALQSQMTLRGLSMHVNFHVYTTLIRPVYFVFSEHFHWTLSWYWVSWHCVSLGRLY